MRFEITYEYREDYLTTHRCRKAVQRKMTACHNVEVRELADKDFPVALKVL